MTGSNHTSSLTPVNSSRNERLRVFTIEELAAMHTLRGMWWFGPLEGELFKLVPRSVTDVYASNLGRIFVPGKDGPRFKSPKMVVARGRTREYQRVAIPTQNGKRSVPIHELVAEAFLGPLPDGLCVRHLDGDYLNNRLANLAYGTVRENHFDAAYHADRPISDSAATHIYWLSKSGLFSLVKVAEIIGLEYSFVWRLSKRKVYPWIHHDLRPEVMPRPAACKEQQTFKAITEAYFPRSNRARAISRRSRPSN